MISKVTDKRFPLSLTSEMHEQLRQISHKRKSSMAEEIRKAIKKYIIEEGEKK